MLLISKPARYGLLFKSINGVAFPYTFCIIVYAGKPPSGNGPFYIPTILDSVKSLVTKLEQSSELAGRNLSFDRLRNSLVLFSK